MQSPSRRAVLASLAGVALASLPGCSGRTGRSPSPESPAATGDDATPTPTPSATPVDSTPADAADSAAAASTATRTPSATPSASGESPAVRTRVLTRDRTTTVPISEYDDLRLTASPGYVLELYALEMAAEPVEPANDGLHSFTVGVPTADAGADADADGFSDGMIGVLFGSSTADHPLRYEGGTWREANNATRPADPSAHARAVRGLVVDDRNGLVLRYRNRTNSGQTAPREVRLWGVERPATDG
jgi:hypothetical protein